VGARIEAFASGLTRLGWEAELVDVAPPRPSRCQDLIERRMPTRLRAVMDNSGCEGDVMPSVWWHARQRIRAVDADVAFVSVPPFSLLAAGAFLPKRTALVLDYRDAWSARTRPHPLGRASRGVERLLMRRADRVTFAGHPDLGTLMRKSLGIASDRLTWVANGLDPNDLNGMEPHEVNPTRSGTPLDLVFVGHWYGRNGPGILLDALARVGPSTARLTAIGSVSPSIEKLLSAASAGTHVCEAPKSRGKLYERIAQADVAIVTMDYASPVESRIPAKVYDYVGVGIPVIAVCPPESGLLKIPEAAAFHHIGYQDVDGLVGLLRAAAADRTALRSSLIDQQQCSRVVGVRALDAVLTTCIRRAGG
jgi:Glycosyltransferase Family 4/Glycosyl transferases group 1